MMRFFNLPVEAGVKVGLIAQAPQGNGGERYYKNFSIEKRIINDKDMTKVFTIPIRIKNSFLSSSIKVLFQPGLFTLFEEESSHSTGSLCPCRMPS